MSERIKPFAQLPPEKLASSQIILLGEEVIRCQYLLYLTQVIGTRRSTVVAMAEQELVEGSRGHAKAQILGSMPAVDTVWSCSSQEVKELGAGQHGEVLSFGKIALRDRVPSFAGESFKRGAEVSLTSHPLDQELMAQAQELVPESDCWWRPTACLFLRDGKVVISAASYNPWKTDCQNLSIRPDKIRQILKEPISFCDGIHAEKVGIAQAARRGIPLRGSCLYLTTCPCEECAKDIIEAGIKRVVFDSEYYNRSGLFLLVSNGVEVAKINNGTP